MRYPSFFVAADELARTGQRQYMNAVRYRLILLAFAALGGAVSLDPPRVDWFAWLALVAFVGALACEVFILAERPDERWYEGRAAAESAKTLAWRFAVGGDPFPMTLSTADATRRMTGRLREIAADLTHVHAAEPAAAGDNVPDPLVRARERSFEQRRDHYVADRVQQQIGWYSGEARANARNRTRFLLATIALEFAGVLGAVLRIAGVVDVDLLGIVAAVAAGAASWAQTRQYGQVGRAYAVAAEELATIRADARDVTEDAWARFVDEAEEAISREHTQWRASRGVTIGRRRAGPVPDGARQRFESVEVVEHGLPRALVAGTRIVLAVEEDGTVSARAGCNGMRVKGGIRDGLLDGPVVMTLKSCGPDRDAQDRWLGAFLGSGPRWERDGDTLTLTSTDTTVVLTAAPAPEDH